MDSSENALAGFDSVWSRVCGEAPCAAPGLDTLAEMAQRQRELLCAIAGRCPSLAPGLNRMAAELARAVRRLAAESFLLTGRHCRPGAACAVIGGTLCALRDAHAASLELAEALSTAANAAACEQRGTLDRLAAAERRHTRELREIILSALGAN